jgi:hypothetical protein
MNSPKLIEAIAELEAQRKIIDDAITQLRKAASVLSGGSVVTSAGTSTKSIGKSYVDDAVRAIEVAGTSLHIGMIIDFITQLRGERPARASVESSVIRHIAKTPNPRLVKVAPSQYDIPSHQPMLAQIAS